MRHQSSSLFWALLVGFIAFCLFSITPAQPVRGQTDQLFVSEEGTSEECTQSAPCALDTAQMKWQDGDTVYIQGGYYRIFSTIDIWESVTLVGGWDGAGDGEVVIDPEENRTTLLHWATNAPVFYVRYVNPLKISGIFFTGNLQQVISINGRSTLVLESNYFDDIESAVVCTEPANIIAVNNIFNRCGEVFFSSIPAGTNQSIYLINNTFNMVDKAINMANFEVFAMNNIFSKVDSDVINGKDSYVYASKNLFYESDNPGDLLSGSWFSGDPSFVDPSSGNFHISEISPARNAGISMYIPGYRTVTVDYDGEARPNEGKYDIGADEFYGPGMDVVLTFFPIFMN